MRGRSGLRSSEGKVDGGFAIAHHFVLQCVSGMPRLMFSGLPTFLDSMHGVFGER